MESSGRSAQTDPVVEHLARIQAALEESSQRAAHRETVIDRLHEENQRLQEDDRRLALEPTLRHLIRLHDQLTQEAARCEGHEPGRLLTGLADEVELVLGLHGVEVFGAVPGEAYRPGHHRPVGTTTTSEANVDGGVSEVVAPGFREEVSQRVLRAVHVRVYRYRPDDDALDEERP